MSSPPPSQSFPQSSYPLQIALSPLFIPLGSLDPLAYSSESSAHPRGDIHLERRVVVPASDAAEPVRVIWGTQVLIAEVLMLFRNFMMLFTRKDRNVFRGIAVLPADATTYPYIQQCTTMRELHQTTLTLDARDLLATGPTTPLYHQLLNYPQEVIPIMDQTVKDVMVGLVADLPEIDYPLEEIETSVYKVRPCGVEAHRGMRELDPRDIDKLVSVKGLVIRLTPVIPDMKRAFFRCQACEHTVTIEIDRGVIHEPTKCPRPACRQNNTMQIIHNRCEFANKQVVRLQETPDVVPDGQTPHSVNLCMYDELVDLCRAGDRVEVCGIFRSLPVRVNSRQRTLRLLFKTYVDVLHVQKVDSERMSVERETVEPGVVPDERELSAEDIERIQSISQRPDLFEFLLRSVAPSIYEMDDVKKGLLLQMFGGSNKQLSKGGRYRGDINILLCGDPLTSKLQLLQYVHKISPRGVYTSGKGLSAVGLTAYVTRDADTKQLVLESGALVLSDGGVCCIDEFDKMLEATRLVLHEVMEQQTISVAKAGIITTLNARTLVLASANPIQSRYNPDLPVTQNIDLPPPLLLRFDLVYLILDKVDERMDAQLARHLTDLYLADVPRSSTEVLLVDLLSKYIQYARNQFRPQLTPDAKNELVRLYVEMRRMGDDVRASERRVTATTRQLELMIRLAEAHAKMRLSTVVEVGDVNEAVRLIRSAIKDYATDPVTGKIDMDLVQTGQLAALRRMADELARAVGRLVETRDSVGVQEVVKLMNEQSTTRVELAEVMGALELLEREGKVTFGSNRASVRWAGMPL